jgi:pimeloyl-ACP methyl ester carboxylesterase
MARRTEILRQLKLAIPGSEPWDKWLQTTGELPPDFTRMPSCAALPDPLLLANGTRVQDAASWQARREELLEQFHHWAWGTVPVAPDNLRAEVVSERMEDGATVRQVRLSFGPDRKAALNLELLIPQGPGPFPVFLTQANHRPWGQVAVSRGYIACVFNGADVADDTDTFPAAYPGYDWSRLTRRAWAASRCIDYLVTLDLVDAKKIAMAGHSRNGKQTLIAGACDERIAVVISSSSGQGGAASARFQAEPQGEESIERITRSFPDWFHPRLRFFAGNEQKLPFDFHEAVALCAPRPCLLSTAFNDPSEVAWSVQQTYLAVTPVYELLGARQNLRPLWRTGAHEATTETVNRYLDFCDRSFGRATFDFPEQLPFPHDWPGWHTRQTTTATTVATVAGPPPATEPASVGAHVPRTRDGWETRRGLIRDQVICMLGAEPSEVAAKQPGSAYGHEPAYTAELLRRNEDSYTAELLRRHRTADAVDRDPVVFGDGVSGDVYLPQGLRGSGKRAPAVLWLHPFSYSKGYASETGRGDAVYRALAQRGVVVFCFDQIGTGARVDEGTLFYTRRPRWSLLGKMVRDSSAALDSLLARSYVDPKKVYVVGYSLGSTVGLHLAALDDRIAGAAFVCPPPSFRNDTDVDETGGIARWSHQTMLLPQLGQYIGREKDIPYDVPDLLACLAPRPVLYITPDHDRHAPLPQVTAGVERARKIYDLYQRGDLLAHKSPNTINTFDAQLQTSVIQWLSLRADLQSTTAPTLP